MFSPRVVRLAVASMKKCLEYRFAQLDCVSKGPWPHFQGATIVVAGRLADGSFCVAVLAAYDSTQHICARSFIIYVISVY